MDIHHTPRLYVVQDLIQGQSIVLEDDPAHYLQHVMRLKIGDALRLFNGRDGEWHGAISDIKKRSVTLTLQQQLRPQQPAPDLWLCCAPIKKAHFDYMIEKATEIGVSAIKPTLTARTQIREVNAGRCLSIVTEAAEQSERLNLPVVAPAVNLDVQIANFPDDRILIVCAEFGEAGPIAEVVKNIALSKAAILTGPEGGFAPDEMQKLRTLGNAVFARLGPRILRADTAAISALTCWQALKGDWIKP